MGRQGTHKDAQVVESAGVPAAMAGCVPDEGDSCGDLSESVLGLSSEWGSEDDIVEGSVSEIVGSTGDSAGDMSSVGGTSFSWSNMSTSLNSNTVSPSSVASCMPMATTGIEGRSVMEKSHESTVSRCL